MIGTESCFIFGVAGFLTAVVLLLERQGKFMFFTVNRILGVSEMFNYKF